MFNLLRYLYYSERFPQYKDYVDMGLGIATRRKRAKRYWDTHCQCSKDFQRLALTKALNAKSIALLGAGRLYDIDTELILRYYKHIDLFDADPSCKTIWLGDKQLASAQLTTHILDITNSILSWTKKLKEELTFKNAAELLNSLEVQEINFTGKYDCIFSINLLSQIPVYWRDRAVKTLDQVVKKDAGGHYATEIQQALESTYRKLQEQHLALLSTSQAKLVVLISDTEWYYYKPQLSPWQVEPPLLIPKPLQLKNYEVYATDSWLWHIVPYASENTDYGEIHKVEAFAFKAVEYS